MALTGCMILGKPLTLLGLSFFILKWGKPYPPHKVIERYTVGAQNMVVPHHVQTSKTFWGFVGTGFAPEAAGESGPRWSQVWAL